MAVDDVLAGSVAEGRRPAVLRLYRWAPACLSLGVFQPWAGRHSLPPDRAVPDVVRRVTGGGAIRHDDEWTYSVNVPRGDPLAGPQPHPLYRSVHAGIAGALAEIGVRCGLRGEPSGRSALPAAGDVTTATGITPARAPRSAEPLLCYVRTDPNDLVSPAGRKIVGSAQRRLAEVVLQHGSIVLSAPPGSPTATSAAEELGLPTVPAATVAALGGLLVTRIAGALGRSPRESFLTDDERRAADALVAAKHAHPSWLQSR